MLLLLLLRLTHPNSRSCVHDLGAMLCRQDELCSISCELDSATLLTVCDSSHDIHTLPQRTHRAKLGTPRHGIKRITGLMIEGCGHLGLVEGTAPRKMGHAVLTDPVPCCLRWPAAIGAPLSAPCIPSAVSLVPVPMLAMISAALQCMS